MNTFLFEIERDLGQFLAKRNKDIQSRVDALPNIELVWEDSKKNLKRDFELKVPKFDRENLVAGEPEFIMKRGFEDFQLVQVKFRLPFEGSSELFKFAPSTRHGLGRIEADIVTVGESFELRFSIEVRLNEPKQLTKERDAFIKRIEDNLREAIIQVEKYNEGLSKVIDAAFSARNFKEEQLQKIREASK